MRSCKDKVITKVKESTVQQDSRMGEITDLEERLISAIRKV